MIMANPRFFQTIRDVEIGERRVTVYGNPFLLEHPDRVVVRASSKFSDEEKARRRAIALDTAAHGGVIVSPFINGGEQALRDECLALGARMIRVLWQGFGEKFKPAQREIELCAQGRLLLVAINPGEPGKETLHKWMAMEMNRVAESLCDYTQPGRWRR